MNDMETKTKRAPREREQLSSSSPHVEITTNKRDKHINGEGKKLSGDRREWKFLSQIHAEAPAESGDEEEETNIQ
jgi:hypothetical protein